MKINKYFSFPIVVFLMICLLFSNYTLKAQSYGNEWINYNQMYFRIKVSKEGIFRIPYNSLVNAGVPLGTFDPRSFQVFNKGIEQYIFVSNENTGTFSANDYIEFYANKNDGSFDTQLYNVPGTQANPYHSLINDTAIYYLTWNSSLNNRRLQIENDTNFTAYTPMPYFWSVAHQNYTSSYFKGETNSVGSSDAEYSIGEGWFDHEILLGGQPRKCTIQTPKQWASGPQATVTIRMVGASTPQHYLRITMPTVVIDTTYTGFKVLTFTRQIPSNMLGLNGTEITFTPVNNGQSADRSTIAYIRIRYPQLFNLNNASSYRMFVPHASQTKAFLDIINFNIGSNDEVLLYDLTNNKKIVAPKSGNTCKALVPNSLSGGEKLCYITTTAQLNYVNTLTPVSIQAGSYARFRNFNASPYNAANYLMVTNKYLMQEATNYMDYRNMSGHNVLLADIDELYDQFAYGIWKHPLAIRNFARYTYNVFPEPPEYLFLIGKSLTAEDYRYSASDYAKTFVPTFGVPASDILFTSRIEDTLFQPAIATGRLSAESPNDIVIYLNKVIEYEDKQVAAQHTPEIWMKNVLHFGGGGNISEQHMIASQLNHYKNVIEDTLFGGYVRTFLKTTTAPIQINQSDSLKNIINNGVSLMTFFGHSSGTGFDQSIDEPSEYNNQGKYPFLFANSCFAGDIFSNSLSSSQAFVLIPNKGVIGYLASTAPSPLSALQLYANWFYRSISYLNYGEAVGKCIQQTIRQVQGTAQNNPFVKEVCLVTVLHGDPAIKLNYFDRPDYEVNTSSVFYTPANVTTELDSFTVNVISTNLGKAVSGNFVVELVRTYPDGTTTDTYQKLIPATTFKDTIQFKLPIDMAKSVGINKLKITLDAFNNIDYEISELNNTVTVDLFIKSNDIIPVYPPKYAVIPEQTVTLKASTGYPFTDSKSYIFQIDTNDYFNSVLASQTVTHAGGVVTWQVPFTLTDSTVYYWRVALDGTPQVWRESSFQYIANKSGWGQAHFFQFKDNTYEYVTFNRPQRDFIFVNNFNSLSVQTGIYPYLQWDSHWYKVNGAILDLWFCLFDTGNGLKFAVFNPVSGKPWYSHKVAPPSYLGPYNNEHCKDYEVPAFDFYTHTNEWRQKVKAFIDTIPNDYYVLVYSHKNHFAQNYSEALKQAFESLGSTNIRYIQNNTPYILFGKKGSPIGSANEVFGSNITDVITLQDSIKTAWNQGYVKSEIIGPASKWNSIHWRYKEVDNALTDSIRLAVLGVKLTGEVDTLLNSITPDSLDILNISAFINPQIYPYIHLVAFMKDDSLHTPSQLLRWHVMYEGVPETCLNPSRHFYFHKDTLQQGEDLVFSCAVENIGNYDMDSLLIKYWIIDKDRNYIPIVYPRQKPHPVGDVIIDTIRFNTKDLSGLNSFWVEVNPNYDQIEQYAFNNIGEIPFYVHVDKINPLLDVTFDGVHILDGDIVSANPLIQITLNDENKFLALNDTTLFRIYLKKPGAAQEERIYFITNGKWNMTCYPASLPENKYRIEYKTGKLPDGIYSLRVQAKDVSQNTSGYYDYTISFKVINKSTITEVLNYPNPFTTSTRFVFTLTGSEVPTYMKIQIMTISGKIVREIDMAELGNIHVGRNITQFAWDGTDMFGDRLANGVYLYRVIARMNDKNIELNETSASKYFIQEFGKMYLLR